MSRKLNIRDIVAGMLWVEDAQVRFDHKDCPAGEDTKARLYVKAVRPTGSWVAHCFNCGNSGYLHRRSVDMSIDEFLDYAGKVKGKEMDTLVRTSGPVPDRLLYPVTMEQKLWLYKKHIFDEDIDKLGMKSSTPNGNYLYVPFVPPAQGYFRRGFGDASVKYRNNVTDYGQVNVFLGTQVPRWVILTEDFISAYRINRDVPECTTIPCMGTNVTDACLKKLLELEPAYVHVWFDPDTAGRTKQTEAISKVSAVMYGTVGGITIPGMEAKNMTPEELQTFLRTGKVK